ncbi:MAG: hypothetical protein FWF86_08910, partial [Clostridia bacterium]|nr:hypothetical protein [Clostridia bacterium]
MKERGRYAAWGVFWLFLAVFCMVGGTSAMEAALPEVHGRVACRYGVEGPGFDEVGLLRDIMAEWAGNGLVTGAVTAWTQTSNTLVQCEETAASLELDVLWVDG